MTLLQFRLVLQLVAPYVDDDNGYGADKDQFYIQVGPLPQSVAAKLESLGVSLEAGILSSGGTLTIFT